MANSDFWKSIAAEFRALDPNGGLRADWDYVVNSGRPYQWRFAGSQPSLDMRFEALARRAASEMPNPGYSDLLLSWLEALRKNSTQLGSDYYAETRRDQPDVEHVVGSVHRICEASADLCHKFESQALQQEFEEKRQNDPKNWSQFRQQYEAFDKLRHMKDEPPERIPEEFVRQALARIHNIKPEDVTDAQIRFEVAGLLSSTRRRIELIPTAPSQETEQPASQQAAEVQANDASDITALRDAYLRNFPDEKIKIRDICWAAGQHYREWKRWLAGELKSGSTPDLAFRRILTSGKRPQEFNKKPRPNGWE
jgi:hypothetical protein